MQFTPERDEQIVFGGPAKFSLTSGGGG